MIGRPAFTIVLLSVLALVGSSCGQGDRSASQASGLPRIKVGDVELEMELALTREEQRVGLMHRDGIEGDHGMLFVFRETQPMSFWMKNVPFPIDIGYFTPDGVLREVYPMYANDTRSRKSIRDDLLYVLEVRSGWFKERGVKPGAQLDLDAVKKAVAARRKQ